MRNGWVGSARRSLGWNRRELAQRAKLSVNALLQIENGSLLDPSVARRIRRILRTANSKRVKQPVAYVCDGLSQRQQETMKGAAQEAPARTLARVSAAVEQLRQTYGDDPVLAQIAASVAKLSPLMRGQANDRQHSLSTDSLRALGAQSRSLRQALGLSRAQLAMHAGIADSTLRNFEIGRHRLTDRCLVPLLHTLLTLADAKSLQLPFFHELRAAFRYTTGLPSVIAEGGQAEDPEIREAAETDDAESWGDSVRRRREALAMQPEDLGARVGLSASGIDAIESGCVEPSAARRRRIERVLHEAEQLQHL
ncbi:MAG TPA: helix-turn-helix domain-containing protein [Pseudomonadota bacterium]|nr:helix-turn-helix domain-containing protein [Pseudomonadota bacterium]